MMVTVRKAEGQQDLRSLFVFLDLMREEEEGFGFEGYAALHTFHLNAATILVVADEDPERFIMLIAEDEDVSKSAGGLIGEVVKVERIMKYDVIGVVRMLYVDEEARRQGVASALMGAFEQEMRERGVRKVDMTCALNNTAPQEGLLKRGYAIEAIQMGKVLDLDVKEEG